MAFFVDNRDHSGDETPEGNYGYRKQCLLDKWKKPDRKGKTSLLKVNRNNAQLGGRRSRNFSCNSGLGTQQTVFLPNHL
jgi:hypothetical protein